MTVARVKLSGCLTTYNRASLLERTLGALAEQSRALDELIVGDDASSDQTPAVVEPWANKFDRFVYLRNERNLSLPGNLNRAVAAASGEYVVILQDGDTYLPDFLESGVELLDRHPTAAFCFFGVQGLAYRTRFGRGVVLHDLGELTPGRVFFETQLLPRFSSIVWGTVMMRGSVLRELLPFDPAYGWISDVDMWMRMCLGNDVAYLRRPMVIADNTPTKQRGFNWEHQEALHRMKMANIERFFGSEPRRRAAAVVRERALWGLLATARTVGGRPLTSLLRRPAVTRLRWRLV